MNTVTDDTSGQCYSYDTSVRTHDTNNAILPFMTYEWQTGKITIDTFDPAYSGLTITVYNDVRLSGISVLMADIYQIQFYGGCATSTLIASSAITYPAREFAPATLSESH